MKVVVIEDDPIFCLELEAMLSTMEYEYAGSTSTFEKSLSLIREHNPCVVISDIQLDNGKTGIELAQALSNLGLPFIFVTAYSDEEVYEDSKKYEKSKFLVKPFDKLTLKSILDSLTEGIVELSVGKTIIDEVLYIKVDNVYQRVPLNTIRYVYSEGNYVTLYDEASSYVLKYSLSKLLTLEKFKRFIRIHRSYAINDSFIDNINFADKLIGVNNTTIPFGRTYIKDVRSLMEFRSKKIS